jgi:hypothetical protein
MAKIVDLQDYRRKTIVDKAFGPWLKRFGEACTDDSRLADLSDATLFRLARPGDESSLAFYEFIMGVLDLDQAGSFYDLENADRLRVVDIHLFLADQVRFEMMRRLGWIERFPCQGEQLLELVRQANRLKRQSRGNPPQLAVAHPEFHLFSDLTDLDKESFIRRLLPRALDAFNEKVT